MIIVIIAALSILGYSFYVGVKIRIRDPYKRHWELVRGKNREIYFFCFWWLLGSAIIFPETDFAALAAVFVIFTLIVSLSFLAGYLSPPRWFRNWME